MKILCIFDENKPNQIPKEKFVKKGEWYELIFIAWCKPQLCQGFELSELTLNESCKPYEYYKGNRFGIRPEDLDEFLQLAKDCSDLDDINIEELLVATNVEVLEEF